MSKLNEKQLHLLLEEHYKCKNLGRRFPKPYCDEDDMPTMWKTPSGLAFDVPTPPNGSTYEEDHIELLIEVACLNVVTNITNKEPAIEDVIKSFKSR